MGTIRIATVVCAAALTLGLAGAAEAKNVPPGLSGAEQYVETTPTVTGGKPTSDGGGASGSPGEAIGQANADSLKALGADGEATARLAAEGAPASGAADGGSGRSGSAQSGVGQVFGQLTGSKDSGGMGVLLPLLIATGAIAATAYGIGRRRGGRTSQLDG